MDCKNLENIFRHKLNRFGLKTGAKHGSQNKLSRGLRLAGGEGMLARYVNTVSVTGEHVSEK